MDFQRGYAVCVAAPGSGKTAVVTARIKKLLALGILPENILSLTFTKEGASEMAKRAGLKDAEFKRNGLKHRMFTTFHSWALSFITHEALCLPFKVHAGHDGNPAPLCLPQDAARILAQIVRRIPMIEWKDAGSYISAAKRRGLSPNACTALAKDEKEEYFVLAYRKYEETLLSRGLLDFDSVMIETANLLERRADVAERWQYKIVQVDEAQDTDAVQWRIVKAITQQHGNALAVGDENQGMYSWRGSESNLTSYFQSVFPGSVVLSLPENFRSTVAIVEYCKEIAPIQNETVTQLHTANEQGVAPEFKRFLREDEEAKFVVNSCVDLGNTAILARTNRQLAAFEDECGQRNVRYKLLGKSGFWGQPEVKDAVAIVGCVAMPSDNNILRMLSSRCDATKFLRKKDTATQPGTITLLQKYQERNPDSASGKPLLLHRLLHKFYSGDSSQDEVVHNIGGLLSSLRTDSGFKTGKAAMQMVVERFGLLAHYDETEEDLDKKNFDNDPRENILKLVEYAGRYENLGKFYDYTQAARRATHARTSCLTLSTIHQSKGKEWDSVHVVGVNDGVLPHKKGELEEEKRIYFVACSRAARRLTISCSGVPSSFLDGRVPKEEAQVIPTDPWAGFQLKA